MPRLTWLLGAACLAAAATAAIASTAAGTRDFAVVRGVSSSYVESVQSARIIVKYKDGAQTLSTSSRVSAQSAAVKLTSASALGQRLGVTLADGRTLSSRTQVLTAKGIGSADLAAIAAQDADVEWAQVDRRVFVQSAPDDPLYATGQTLPNVPTGQWYLHTPDSTLVSAIDVETAWAITQGSSSIVIADVDTGITSHPDISAKLFTATFSGTTSSTPYGYDFVGYSSSDSNGGGEPLERANDGSLADPDPSDPGDWITAAENASGTFAGCGEANSSWHGTQTAGILAASTGNDAGMAGVGYNTMLVPVRALGKCGGWTSDIAVAAEWAGGIAVSDVPTNTHPARVINMSLGSSSACDSIFLDALTALRNASVIVVAAAGNDYGLAVNSPGNCQPASTDTDQTPIVIAVAGLRHMGTKVAYSDLGPQVTISAPAGNCGANSSSDSGENATTDTFTLSNPCEYAIMTTVNTGTTSPVSASYSNAIGEVSLGTSFATPMVAGTVALMLAASPSLTNAQVISLLKSTARAFPTSSADTSVTTQCHAPNSVRQDECVCTTATCGAGMLDAGAAVTAAAALATPTATITGGGASIAVGGTLTLDGSSSTAANGGQSISSYAWSITSGSSYATLSATSGSSVTLTGVAAGSVTVQLTVTDSSGQTASTTTTATVTSSSSSSSSTSSGGGATSPAWLLGLALAGLMLAPRGRRRPR